MSGDLDERTSTRDSTWLLWLGLGLGLVEHSAAAAVRRNDQPAFEQHVAHIDRRRQQTAAVVADIDDQSVALAFRPEIAMKLREASGHHVG